MEHMKLDALKDRMKTFGMKPLAEKAGVSRTSLYNLVKGENFESDTLERVLKVLNVELGPLNKTPSQESVLDHMGAYGAPLAFDPTLQLTMNLEETTKWGLQYSATDGLLESLMPYFLLLNFKKLNRVKLLTLLDQETQFQLLCYFLELSNAYAENKKLKEFLNTFNDHDFPVFHFGDKKPSARALEVLGTKRNPAAKKWNVLSLNSVEDYFDRFRKWDKVV
jgi:transcriptional regulator with XRE-family HTH domain